MADEYVSGTRSVFTKFDRYMPRQEPASYVAGGHEVKLDRVEWKVIPDPATAANALATGEVDWLELPQPDLVPMLKATEGVTTGMLDIYGTYGHLRPNHIQGPDRQSRRAPSDAGGDQSEGRDDRRDGRGPGDLAGAGRLFHSGVESANDRRHGRGHQSA